MTVGFRLLRLQLCDYVTQTNLIGVGDHEDKGGHSTWVRNLDGLELYSGSCMLSHEMRRNNMRTQLGQQILHNPFSWSSVVIPSSVPSMMLACMKANLRYNAAIKQQRYPWEPWNGSCSNFA